MEIKRKPMALAALLCVAIAQPTLVAKPLPGHAEGIAGWEVVRVDSAWIRAAPPGSTMLAGYMILHNESKSPVRLVSASSDTFGMVELHRTTVVGGVSTMRPAGEQIIAAGGTLKIETGGLHWMLMQPTRALQIGDRVRIRLHFAKGADTDVDAIVDTRAPAVTAH